MEGITNYLWYIKQKYNKEDIYSLLSDKTDIKLFLLNGIPAGIISLLIPWFFTKNINIGIIVSSVSTMFYYFILYCECRFKNF